MVVFGALALAVLPPLVRMIFMGLPPEWGDWIYRALTFLVISCPCALVISIPLTFFAGIGGAGKAGILVKGSVWLEELSRTGVVVFDKTGTLTQGIFEVTAVHHSPLSEEDLLEYAALAESSSSHPIAVSIRKACSRPLDLSRIGKVQEFSGSGVVVEIDGNQVIFEVQNGNLFSIYGREDWDIGDRAILLFDNNGTHELEDDIIIREFYRG